MFLCAGGLVPIVHLLGSFLEIFFFVWLFIVTWLSIRELVSIFIGLQV